MQAQAEEYREAMIDAISMFDDELAEKFLGGEEISNELIKKAIRKGVVSNELYPMLCGTALGNKGVQLVLNAVIDFLPSPLDRGEIVGHNPDKEDETVVRKADLNEPVSAIAFKIMTDPFVGTLTFVRVYSGVIKSGDTLLNSVTEKKELEDFCLCMQIRGKKFQRFLLEISVLSLVLRKLRQDILFVILQSQSFLKKWSSLIQ